MPTSTDLSVRPYFNDFDPDKNYYKVLFKPGAVVQTRELNALQSILQDQIEKFGNNIYKRGTIIDGCNFVFYENYPYAKLVDSQLDGQPTVPDAYVGLFVKNPTNLRAYVVDSAAGFESTDPDLKTIYLKYINSGDTGLETSFAAGQTLTVYDSNTGIWEVIINNGGSAFSNADSIAICPAIVVNTTSSNSFVNGHAIVQATTNARATVVEVNTTIYENKTVLKLKPLLADLQNSAVNSTAWTFSVDYTVSNSADGTIGNVEDVIGSGAVASLVTDGSGQIITISMEERGVDYTTLPYVTVQSANGDINGANLQAVNFKCQVKVASVAEAVGNGYAFGVSEGVVYQKGHFIEVHPQTVIVEKYSNSPNNVMVVFQTDEEIINSDVDQDLLDNALGSRNYTAPGADRLKLTPNLQVMSSDSLTNNSEFFPLVEWSEGKPFKQNRRTQYNIIGDEMSQRLDDSAGDFVLDQFLVTTRSPVNTAVEANTVSIVVDPGKAYVSGYRTFTDANYVLDVDKGLDTNTHSAVRVSLNYGNYVRVKELGGVFLFSTGDVVDLRDTAGSFLSNTAFIEAGISAVGNKIGEARIRSLVLESGTVGDPNAVYRLYLFDIKLNAGKAFSQVKSIYYNGASRKGIADCVLELDATTNAQVAKIYGGNNSKLIFYSGYEAPANIANTTYIYRMIKQNGTISGTGVTQVSLASDPTEFFPYTGTLSDSQEQEVLVIPLDGGLRANVPLTGTVSVTTTSNVVTGSGSQFVSELRAGDYVFVWSNATNGDVHRVTAVTNNISFQMDSNNAFTNTTANVSIYWPQGVPIALNQRSTYFANVDANGNILTVSVNTVMHSTSTSNVAIVYNVERRSASETPKTVKRDQYVKIYCGNNVANTVGPWCLGIPDIFRLKGVWTSTSSSVSESDTEVTDEFFIDHNQNVNYYDHGFLFKKPLSGLSLTSSDYLLVKFDAFDVSGVGFFDVVSYVSSNLTQRYTTDSKALANLVSNEVNSFEIPEMFGYTGEYFDLINEIDFRPRVTNTAAYTNVAASANLNPAYTVAFGNTADPANNKKFPLPDSVLRADVTEFLGRKITVNLAKDGTIYTADGIPGSNVAPTKVDDTLLLNVIDMPAYPALPQFVSSTVSDILDKKVANEKYSLRRYKDKRIRTLLTANNINIEQPKGYSMADIGNLERRIRDLEYYVALNLVEAKIKDKVIPSSVTPSINRFKFGFFVDDYGNLNYSDVENPEYRASVVDTKVLPPQELLNIIHVNDDQIGPYTDFKFLSQLNATSPPVVNTTNTSYSPTVYNSLYANQANRTAYSETKKFTEPEVKIVMGSYANTVTIYFCMYSGRDEFFLYQGNTANTSQQTLLLTGNAAVALSANDVALLKKDTFFTADNTAVSNVAGGAAGGAYIRNFGKITFNYNPSAGRNFTLKVLKNSVIWRYRIDYPADNPVGPPAIVQPSTNTGAPVYAGTLSINPEKFNSSSYSPNGGAGTGNANSGLNGVYQVPNQKFTIRATGLKPNTQHRLYLINLDQTMYCIQTDGTIPGSVLTQPANNKTDLLKSSSQGVVEFDYYFNPSSIASDYLALDGTKYVITGGQFIRVVSADGASYAFGTIKAPYNN